MRKVFPVLAFMVILSLLVAACRPAHQDYLAEEESPGVDHPETSGFRVVTREEIDPPQPAFNFSLTAQSGEQVSLEDLRGQVVMMGFIYTHCPEACPIVAANFRRVWDELAEAADEQGLTQVLVTTDPERDTPERLKRYTEAMGGEWLFLTGSLDEVRAVWDAYDIYWENKERTQEIVVFHSYKTYLIDREGQLRLEFVGVWYPDEIMPDVQNLLAE